MKILKKIFLDLTDLNLNKDIEKDIFHGIQIGIWPRDLTKFFKIGNDRTTKILKKIFLDLTDLNLNKDIEKDIFHGIQIGIWPRDLTKFFKIGNDRT